MSSQTPAPVIAPAAGAAPVAAPVTTAAPIVPAHPLADPAAPTPSPAPVVPLPAAGTATPNDYKWAGDDAAQAVAKAKGWASPAEAIKSYNELQSLLGSEKVPVPKNDQDAEGWNRFYKAAGRPDAPDQYGLEIAAGGTKENAAEFAKAAHDLGLSTKQAQGLAKWFDGKAGGMTTASTAEVEQRIGVESAAVRDDWGPNFNQNAQIASRGAKALDLDKAAINALEESPSFGHKKLMGMLFKYGKAGGESGFVEGSGGSFAPQTKEAAAARIAEIKANPNERSEALKQGSTTNKEMERLSMIVSGMRV